MSRVADAMKRSNAAAVAADDGEAGWPPLRGTAKANPGGGAGAAVAAPSGRSPSVLLSDVRLVVSPHCSGPAREQYRRLAVSLHQAQVEHGLHTVMVTSAVPREGKSLTAVNLALTLSGPYGRRVLLIDGDLRQPSVHTLLRLSNASGLTDTLLNDRPLSLLPVMSGLWVLPAGPPCPDPLGSLMSNQTRQLIDEARGSFDWVIVDTPPVGVLPDAGVLASAVEATILVVAAGRTPLDQVQRAADALGAGRVFGVVLNRVEEDASEVDYAYYRHYDRPRAEDASA